MRRRAYLLAHPAGHSLSPRMHQAAFAALGLDATYQALDVPPTQLGAAVAAFRQEPAFLGANVTTPHKRAVAAHLDRLTTAASVVGAVNTVIYTPDGLEGDNTDVTGFTRALAARRPVEPGTKAAVIGAGGAARASVYALLTMGMSVVVAARSPSAAEDLATELAPHVAHHAAPSGVPHGAQQGGVWAVDATGLAAELEGASLLVNATTVGMVGGPAELSLPLDVDVGLLPPDALVYDLVYRPRQTPLLRAAAERGLATLDGLSMLVWQGAASLEAWTGMDPPVEAMFAAVSGAGDAGSQG